MTDKLTGNFDKTESLTVTMPMEEFDKLEKLALSAHTDKLSVEKLEPIGYYNGAHGFLHDEFDKDCYCQGGCYMEAVYTESQVKKLTDENTVEKLQEQLNTAKKALTEISKTKDFYRSGRDHWEEFSQDALKAQKALAALEGGEDE